MTTIFESLLTEIYKQNTNEEILQAIIQKRLLKPDLIMVKLIGTDRLEEMIKRKKLNDSQRQGLDFLKETFINLINKNHQLNTFLMSNENKIKAVLAHVDSELSKCNEDATKKDAFKDVIKNYFNIINDRKLDEFKDKVFSGC